ncbi:unnamed protein product, partial [Discosporangium mesarthrocarpum]
MDLFEEWDEMERRPTQTPAQNQPRRAQPQGQARAGVGLGLRGQQRPVAQASGWGKTRRATPAFPATISSARAATHPTTSSTNPFVSNPFGSNPFAGPTGGKGGGGAGVMPESLALPDSRLAKSEQQRFGTVGDSTVDHGGMGHGSDGKSTPIFSLKRLDLLGALAALSQGGGRGASGGYRAPSVTWSILAVAVGNGVLVMGTSDCRVIRWDVDGGSAPQEVEISRRPEDSIHKLFLDPTGSHLLVCLHTGETYYLNARTNSRPKRLARWSGAVVEAVAFDRQRCTETCTKGIVVGTRSGCLYESVLESTGKERPFTLVYRLGQPQQDNG